MSFISIFKETIKRCFFPIVGHPLRVNKRIKELSNNQLLTIINLHKVNESDGSGYSPLNPEIFKNLINFLSEKFYITSFSEIYKKNSFPTRKPKVILSFDDGYKDFIDVIHPILKEYGIRANQNIIPKCVDNKRPPLNVALQDFIGKSKGNIFRKIDVPGYEWNRLFNKTEEANQLSKYLKNHPFKKQLEFEKIIYDQIGDDLYSYSTEMMNLTDIKKIFNEYDWGAHSFSHANMGLETDSFFINDLKLCRSWFKKNLDMSPYIYAFPNGSYKKHQLLLARNEGFSTILLVNNNFSSINNRIHSRFGFHAFRNSEMRFKAVGSFAKT